MVQLQSFHLLQVNSDDGLVLVRLIVISNRLQQVGWDTPQAIQTHQRARKGLACVPTADRPKSTGQREGRANLSESLMSIPSKTHRKPLDIFERMITS